MITDDESECEDGIADTIGVVESNNNHHLDKSKLEEGVTHFLALYEGSCFPGLVLKLKKKTVEVSCMGKNGVFGWKWPQHPDIHDYPLEDLVAVIISPKALNKRNNYSVPEADYY